MKKAKKAMGRRGTNMGEGPPPYKCRFLKKALKNMVLE